GQPVFSKPEVIVLDVGNVLIGLDFSRRLAHLKSYFPGADDLARAQRWIASVENTYGLGLMTTEEFIQQAQQALGLSRERFITLWNDIFIERRYLVPFVQELHEWGYTLAICSNTNDLHAAYFQGTYPCFQYIKHSVFSHRVHALK